MAAMGLGIRKIFFPPSNCRIWSTSGSSRILARLSPSGLIALTNSS